MNQDTAIYKVFSDNDTQQYEHFAALDIGSNSFHLVVTRMVEGALQIVHKVKHKVRLAEGLDANNRLSKEYIDKGVETLSTMTPVLQGLPHRKVRVVATYTLRRARNAREFLRAARSVFPYPIEVISGAEEARLIYVGIFNGISHTRERLIFDIGGGSTEFAVGRDADPAVCKSVNMGCVSYQKRFFADGNISYKACESAINEARRQLELAGRRINDAHWQHVYASSGTAKAIAKVVHATDASEPVSPVSKHELQLLLTQCVEKGSADALDFVGLTDERKPVFAAGVCIMMAVFQSLSIDQFTYSPYALREGVLAELMPAKANQNVCLHTAQSMVKRYHVDTQYAHQVLQSCMHIYNAVKQVWQIEQADLRFVLGWASLLHEVGLHINAKGLQKHSAYILQHTDMPGFNQEQQLAIATLVRFHRKRIRREEFPEFVNYALPDIEKLIAILRLALVLNINRKASAVITHFGIESNQQITVHIDKQEFATHPLLDVDLEIEQANLKALDIELEIRFIDA
ncbi:MAG: exopolyphosphatase [Pseudomonadota bacterium]